MPINIKKIINWWREIDRPTFYIVSFILIIGWLEVVSVSGAVANRTNISANLWIKKQALFVLLGFLMMILMSLLSVRQICFLSAIVGSLMILAMIFVLFGGKRIKGSTRWIQMFGMTIQPSEVLKPYFIVINGVILGWMKLGRNPKSWFSLLLFCVIELLLFFQPDIGMFLIYGTVWGFQIFIAGVAMKAICWFLVFGLATLFVSYFLFSHVNLRLGAFLFSGNADISYQPKQSLSSMSGIGLFGKGLGDGNVKYLVPDVHSDYIFSAIGEECGFLICLVIMGLYCFILFRFLKFFIYCDNKPRKIMGFGFISLFVIHIFVNVGVSLNILPTKGTTLPFISYGGSSIISACTAVGFLLSLSRYKSNYAGTFANAKRKLIWSKSLLCEKNKIL